MTTESDDWPYPGSRWWKFDFHTHTPASADTIWAEQNLDLSPKDWLRKYMQARVDCVAVTDHNSSDWIDRLQSAYREMKQQADAGTPPEGFRKLTLFPGVEISVNGGVHLLAIFDPSETANKVTELLGAVGYKGQPGGSDAVTQKSPAKVVQAVLDAGGIPIPAHADGPKGLLQVQDDTRKSVLDANTVRQFMAVDGLLAVEWVDVNRPPPECVQTQFEKLAHVLGSDCHNFRGDVAPGSRYTWVKMAQPTLEGLRLALLDGNGFSVRRSDEQGAFEPFQTPTQFVVGIGINSARFMGNGTLERLGFTPYCNVLVGGRGTGKSTIVHALRLAYRRDEELKRLGENTEPHRRFASFAKPARGRDGDSALRDDTEICVDLMRDGILHRLRWRQDSQGRVVEEQGADGEWRGSPSQEVASGRFPIRLFSQGQIAAMAGEGRRTLLDLIDEAAQAGDLKRDLEEKKRTWLSQRTKLRELDGRLAGRPELERRLADLERKLATLAQSQHAEVLKAHERALRQGRELEITLEQLQKAPGRIDSLAQDLLLDDWPGGTFDPATNQDLIAWRTDAEQVLDEVRKALEGAARSLREKADILAADDRFASWRQRADNAQADYQALQAALAEQEVADPRAFERLAQERQQIEGQLQKLSQLQEDRKSLASEIEAQWVRVLNVRKEITRQRKEFLQGTLANNKYVRMGVIAFGFDAHSIERDLRDLLDCQDDRFENDILQIDASRPKAGLAFELTRGEDEDREVALDRVKGRLTSPDETIGGRFRKYLQRKLEKPEFADHIRCWFPEDDLSIEYSRGGDGSGWSSITQGSQGQRSAALLAFLLAFGDEPLILDQPEDDLDNHLIYELIVRQIRENKHRRQLIIVTHNPNVVVNGDAEMVHALDFAGGQCRVVESGALQQPRVREEICRVMEGGREALSRRWARLGREV